MDTHSLQRRNYIDRDPAKYPRVSDAKLLQQQAQEWTLTYLSTLTDQQLNAEAELRFPDGVLAVRTPALILHHVLTHAFHHKGQIVAMCRELGYPAPGTDLSQLE